MFEHDGASYVITDITLRLQAIRVLEVFGKESVSQWCPAAASIMSRRFAVQVRFTFCKKDETLAVAEERLQKLKSINHS